MGSDVMERVAKYVWQIAPQDYLPPNEEFAAGGYVFTVNAEGNEVFFVTEEHEFNHSVLENAEENLRSYCDAVQLQEFRSYGLKPNSFHGKAGTLVFVEPPGAVASGAVSGNVMILDVDGSVIFNAKEEEARKRQAEVERLQRVAERLLKCRDDPRLRAMQLSFGKACADPSDELIHLYEIKDAAASIFRDKADACRKLGVAEDAWDTFHKICNDFPLTQGRHRGSKYAELRQATHEELKFARQFARDLIVGYIAYIERERTRQ